MRVSIKSILSGGASIAALLIASGGAAVAGGFGIAEQSSSFLGSAYAGAAAGGDASSMYYNPAAITTVHGIQSESHVALGIQDASTQATSATRAGLGNILALPGINSNSGNIYDLAAIPSSYFSYQYSDRLFFGIAVNSPFGSVTKPSNYLWAGSTLAETSSIKTFDINPNVAYKIAPGLSVGAGLQFELMKIDQKFAAINPASPANPASWPVAELKGDSVAFGFTLGVLWEPTQTTHIGLGYRSGVDHDVHANLVVATGVSVGTSVPINLPDQATLSLRQSLSSQFDLLATGQWTHWSKLKELDVGCVTAPTVPAPAGIPCTSGSQLESQKLNWDDGWFFSLGGEYKYNRNLLLRAGVAWEKSPIQDATQQVTNIIDSDRLWLTTGFGYKFTDTMTVDMSYAHVFFKDSSINRTDPLSGINVVGTTQRQADVIGLALKKKWGEPEEPLK